MSTRVRRILSLLKRYAKFGERERRISKARAVICTTKGTRDEREECKLSIAIKEKRHGVFARNAVRVRTHVRVPYDLRSWN